MIIGSDNVLVVEFSGCSGSRQVSVVQENIFKMLTYPEKMHWFGTWDSRTGNQLYLDNGHEYDVSINVKKQQMGEWGS